MNDLIDSFGRREAALRRHVPVVLLLVVFVSFVLAGCVIGFAAGLSQKRVALPTHRMIAMMVLWIFIIIVLDRPRRGLVRIDQSSLMELKASLDDPLNTPSPGSLVSVNGQSLFVSGQNSFYSAAFFPGVEFRHASCSPEDPWRRR